jgi:hypothetical protein
MQPKSVYEPNKQLVVTVIALNKDDLLRKEVAARCHSCAGITTSILTHTHTGVRGKRNKT